MINPPERYQSVMAVRGISVVDEEDIWNWRWNPLTLQAEGFVENMRNLPHWREHIDPPTEYDAETLLRELPVYLLPGLLFGASLELAAEVGGRLAILLIALLALLWFSGRR